MNARRFRWLAVGGSLRGVVIAAVLALVACGGGGDEDTPFPEPTPWPSPTPRATVAPATSPEPSATSPQGPTPTAPAGSTQTPTASQATPTEPPTPTVAPTPTVEPTPTVAPPTPTAATTPRPLKDIDGDGYPEGEDCDDLDGRVNPGADETCNGINDDCDLAIDEGVKATFYLDEDGDDFGQDAQSVRGCLPPAGYVPIGGDCDDTTASVNPDAAEVCDGDDNNCDGSVDEGLLATFYQDDDNDGFGNPDFIVQGCEGEDGYAEAGGDCDDTNSAINPDAEEICDEIDNNCNDAVDEDLATVLYPDFDLDGFGDTSAAVVSCQALEGHVAVGDDCNDRDSFIYPGAYEHCDDKDNDCDEVTDEDGPFFYLDEDGDGYGGDYIATYACQGPDGYVANNTDCDDDNAEISPGASEFCGDVLDNDCDGIVDEAPDQDGDGWPGCGVGRVDCDDEDNTRYPDAPEIWGDDIDQDCDGFVDADIYVVRAKEDRPETDKPWATSVQAAINLAEGGELIAVDAGTFYGPLDYKGKTLKVIGMTGAEATILDGLGFGSVALFVTGEGRDSVLEDVTLIGGIGSVGELCGPEDVSQWGGGICIRDASPTIRGCIVQDNQAARGAGVSVVRGSPLLEGNLIYANYAEDDGGGAYLHDTDARWVGNTFYLNTTDERGGGMFLFQSDPDLSNNIFVENSALEWGGGLALFDSSPTLYNNTVVANESQVGAGLHIIEDSSPLVSGNILAFNRQASTLNNGHNLYVFTNRGNAPVIKYNGFYSAIDTVGGISGFTTDNTSLVGNPMFIDDPSDANNSDNDYHLQAGSPFIDTADPDSARNDPDGSRGDMGVYGGPDALK